MSIGALIGWQWFPYEGFSVGLGIGVDKYFPTNQKNDSNLSGFMPALRFDVGFAW